MMRPHYLRPVICREATAWGWKDSAIGFLVFIALIGLYGLAQLNDTRDALAESKRHREADRAAHLASATYPGVRIIADEGQFICAPPTKIRTEWTDTIGRDCQQLAQKMYAARASE